MSSEVPAVSRRTAIRTAGGAIGAAVVVGLSGTAAALRACPAYDGADVHDDCAGTKIGEVSGDECGDVLDSCEGPDGGTWYYVDWDDASPDGWCEEGEDVLVYE